MNFPVKYKEYEGFVRCKSRFGFPRFTLYGIPSDPNYVLNNILLFTNDDQDHYASYGNESNLPYFVFRFLDYKFKVSAYTLRSHPSTNYYLSSWNVTVSSNGHDWKPIDYHYHDSSLYNGNTETFSINTDHEPCSYIKVIMTAKNGDFCMRVTNIDFFGTFYPKISLIIKRQYIETHLYIFIFLLN